MKQEMKQSLIRQAGWMLLLTIIPIVGCSGTSDTFDATVQGTVTIDDELVSRGTVTFHPKEGGVAAIGRIHPDGSYSLRTGQGNLRDVDGGQLRSGDYVVTVEVTGPSGGELLGEGGPPISGPRLMAAKYASKETSDLLRTVKPGPNVFNLPLQRAAVEPPGDETTSENGEEKNTSSEEATEETNP